MTKGVCRQFFGSGICNYSKSCKSTHVRGSSSRGGHAISKTNKAHLSRKKALILSNTPLDDFFAEYSPFAYNPRRSATGEFKRLCKYMGRNKIWKPEEALESRGRFKDALVLQFNKTYGTEVDSLRSWQALCGALGLDEIPSELKDCKDLVRGVHVNIVDFVDARQGGRKRKVKTFDTESELSSYTISTKKFFPQENAYAGGLLRYLLRHILS